MEWLSEAWLAVSTWLGEVIAAVIVFLIEALFEALAAFAEFFDILLRALGSALLNGVLKGLALIPVPEYFSGIQGYWDSIPWETLGYFAEPFHIAFGLVVMTGVAVVRWGMRVIPYIGGMFKGG